MKLKIGVFLGGSLNKLGEPIPINNAHQFIFGLVLLNDWSSRDIQGWEFVPLGPLTSKNFQTSISPWIITMDALEPFVVPMPAQDPAPHAYLCENHHVIYNLSIDTLLKTSSMSEYHKISTTNMQNIYWSLTQQLAHHTVSGCNMRPGDLLGSGTISGPTPDSIGCLWEMTRMGANPIVLPNGETRGFLNDGDEIVMIGKCEGNGYTIGFGDLKGLVLPAN